ncbi:MAG: HD domain-containing protein [Candidatus Pacebacteria bacterium]|nr:HD domain-containing protein [Candidatus Paceibacterota bacterium]MDD2757431.1 HD domain-containing protein [Candidatus Paceibacterota bacterium]MDD3283807.1 HD domain-containing protein [Candidatus Paceibacterota bacterium]MDD3970013.1 HD domain-containing protein [Candidatus Paceibacterota bacterium]MDD4738079.1 HD domain-containing protein [Candidatus Paceibacterota bacterium]
MKIDKKIIESIKQEAKEFFIKGDSSHDWSHVERVYNSAIKIAKEENANLDVVKIAVYLHDIGRNEEIKSRGKICHAEKGAEIAKKMLSKYNIDEKLVENIIHCILSHRNKNNHHPETIEAKVLFDADKLDSIGAIGIARDFLFAGIYNAPLYTGREKEILKEADNYAYTRDDTALLEYYHKLSKIKDRIITKTAKKIARDRHNYMKEFFERFNKEIKGTL